MRKNEGWVNRALVCSCRAEERNREGQLKQGWFAGKGGHGDLDLTQTTWLMSILHRFV